MRSKCFRSFSGWPRKPYSPASPALDDTRHDFDGKAVAKITQDQADQVGSVGAKVSSGNVMNIAQRRDGGIDLLDRCFGDFPFWRSTSDTVETDTPACFATSMMLTFFKTAP